jgi:UDP-N-acetylmuramoyl-tripeptide--D-alanyl-D-alanine ligase
MRDAALAIAVAREHGVDPEDAAQGIRDARLSSSRMQIVRIAGWTVIDDAYNANPTSVPATLRSAKELAGGRPVWAILGRMAELGAAAADEHRRIGRLVAALRYDGLIVAGDGVEEIVQGAGGAAASVGTIAEAVDAARDLVPDGAVVVVKASRSVGLDRLVDEFGATRDRVS